ncbi:hypothetical protein O181_090385 [Austropuccinia psidii MF-1]|uniref:Uncharacterized protein n=1 Tax=Austropuccinia psidii MF-1 TaxID=1389203 RepID=A0A9Q3P716_9BASI|nr:hypothetical protein [Austropuccinia psidii MF-1]
MISEPELQLSMSNSKMYKSHSEGSDRHLHEPVQAVLHSVQRQGLGNVATNTPRSDELLENPQKEYHAKKTEETKEEAPSQPTSPRREEEQEKGLEKTILPDLQDSKNPRRCQGQCLQHGQNLDGINQKKGIKNETTSFHKEITLSSDVLNTSTEIQNSTLPLKDIKNSLLSIQEMNNNLSSLKRIVVQKHKEIDNIKFMA